MAIISSVGGVQQEVDAVIKASRQVAYPRQDAYGYCLSLDIVPTTFTNGSTYFAMRNLGSKTAYLTHVELALMFAGTAAVSVASLKMLKFAGATPTGGTSIVPVKKLATNPVSTMSDARFIVSALTIV